MPSTLSARCSRYCDSARGLSLLEIVMALAVLAIALTGTIGLYLSHVRAGRRTEERRIMAQWGESVLDRLQAELASSSVQQIFSTYLAGQAATRISGNQIPAEVKAVDEAASALISIINDESPKESDFGFDPSSSPPPIGVDIDGLGRTTDTSPAPFPLDLNQDGDTNDAVLLGTEMKFLPVVVTVRWQSVFGTGRVDVFGIIAAQSE